MSYLKQLQQYLVLKDNITNSELLEKCFDTCAFIIYLNRDHFLYVFHDDYNKYLEVLTELQIILKKTTETEIDIKTYKKYEKTFLLTEAIFLIKLENYLEAEKKLDRFLIINKKYDHRLGLAHYNLLMANIQNVRGNKDIATKYLQNGFLLFKEHGNPESYAHSLLHLANWYFVLGDYQKAEKFYSECYNSSQKGLVVAKALALLGLGSYYQSSGNFDKARECFLKSLEIKQKNNEEFRTRNINNFEMWPYANLGELDLLQGLYEQALIHFKNSLSLSKKGNEIYPQARNYLNLITVFSLINSKKTELLYTQEAKKYLDQLNELNRSTGKKKAINIFYKIAAGIYYMNTPEKKNERKAMVFFDQVIKDQSVRKLTRISALKLLAQLLLSKIENKSDQKIIIEETKSLIAEMKELMKDFNHNALIADVMFLEAKLAVSTFDLDRGIELLNKTKQFVQKISFKRLDHQINIEFNKLIKSTSKFGYKALLLLKIYNELNLTRISELLQISKTATIKHLAILEKLGLITVTKLEQIRSKKNKVKYYQLTESGGRIFENISSIDFDKTGNFQTILSLRIFNLLFENLEYKLNPTDSKIEESRIEISQLYLTEEQYQEYQKIELEFKNKISNVVSQKKTLENGIEQKKEHIILNFRFPISNLT